MTAEQPQGAQAERTERPLVIFTLDDQRYGLALERVQRAIRVVAVSPLPGAPGIVLGVVDLAGVVLPVVDVRRRFGLAPRGVRLSDHLLVVTTARRPVALLVDETLGVVHTSAGRLAAGSEILPQLELVDGALQLDDGLILIHDLDRLLSLEEERAIDGALRATLAGDPGEQGGIEDRITTEVDER